MILADATVVVAFIRTGDAKLRRIIVNEPAAICGVTRAEILHGAHDPAHRHRMLVALNLFQQLGIPDTVWDQVGDNLATLRRAGLTMPLADVILATLAISVDMELWARDVHFGLIQKVIPALKLFQEPP